MTISASHPSFSPSPFTHYFSFSISCIDALLFNCITIEGPYFLVLIELLVVQEVSNHRLSLSLSPLIQPGSLFLISLSFVLFLSFIHSSSIFLFFALHPQVMFYDVPYTLLLLAGRLTLNTLHWQ